MTDTFTTIHSIITGIIALGMLVIAARALIFTRQDKKQQEIDCLKRQVQTLETKCAVIDERLSNEKDGTASLREKIDDIMQLLLDDHQ